jgi:hypothetical protein
VKESVVEVRVFLFFSSSSLGQCALPDFAFHSGLHTILFQMSGVLLLARFSSAYVKKKRKKHG